MTSLSESHCLIIPILQVHIMKFTKCEICGSASYLTNCMYVLIFKYAEISRTATLHSVQQLFIRRVCIVLTTILYTSDGQNLNIHHASVSMNSSV